MEYIITQMDDISAMKDISASAFDYTIDMNDLSEIVPEMPNANIFSISRSITPKSFECSHKLDNNSLKALQYDDEEDQVQQMNSRCGKQKAKGDSPKSFRPGEPCVVCGDSASGIHYSVWACNGCKTFFRRVVIENKTYSCKRNGSCRINKSMRCACRHCRFRKCLKVGMDCTELNIERRRKKRIAESATSPSTNIKSVDDPIIRELLVKEHQFVKLLTSTLTPIHATIEEALRNTCIFDDFEAYTQSQMLPGDQMNFSYWRAKILSTMIEWAKSFPEFTALSIKDQEALVVHTSFSNMVLSEAFHTPERYTDRIVFPDGLSGFRNVSTNILKERSGLIPTVAAVINSILVPIRKLKITEIEYTVLQAIILFDPESISLSKEAVTKITEKRDTLIESMRRHTQSYSDNDIQCGFRLAELLLRVSNVQKVAAFKRETLCTIETFNLMSPHTLTMEISKKYPDTSFF